MDIRRVELKLAKKKCGTRWCVVSRKKWRGKKVNALVFRLCEPGLRTVSLFVIMIAMFSCSRAGGRVLRRTWELSYFFSDFCLALSASQGFCN